MSPLLSHKNISALFSLLLLCCCNGQAVHDDGLGLQDVSVSSLKPTAVCSASEGYGPNTVKIVHRYGPCSPFPNSKPDHHQILAQDALRVASLQAILSSASGGGNASASGEFRLVSLPAQRGIYLGTANYVVKLDLGTPQVSQTVEIDTGSSVCWVQCKPCLQKQLCYPQEEPIFDPSASSTYRQIPCASAACRALHGAACGSSRQCGYRVVYGDKSYTIGSLAVDQLTLTPTNVFPNFVFGCGENNKGLFGKAAGLFGLARSPFSLVSQTASRLGNVFSYCLPTTSRATGHLTLGNSSVPTAAYTPMLTDRPLFYFINLIGISVGGVPLPVPPTVFQAGGTIIDSGTVITRLPPSAYSALRSAFSSRMSQYPRAQPSSLLDTCFDFTNLESITYPRITLHYSGVGVTLPFAGVFYVFDVSRICLAFAPNALPNDPNIIGNVQQVGFEVIYDIGAQRIGFAPGTCG